MTAGGRQKGRIRGSLVKEKDGAVTGRITGIVRRYYPIDVRDPQGAALHFHVSQDEVDDARFVCFCTVLVRRFNTVRKDVFQIPPTRRNRPGGYCSSVSSGLPPEIQVFTFIWTYFREAF